MKFSHRFEILGFCRAYGSGSGVRVALPGSGLREATAKAN